VPLIVASKTMTGKEPEASRPKSRICMSCTVAIAALDRSPIGYGLLEND
jgi:hypothetical protein